MFVRVKSTPNSPRKSVQIVASVRQGENVRQKIIRHVGIAMDEEELVLLKELAQVTKARLEAEHQPQLFPPEQVARQIIEAKAQSDDRQEPLHVDLRQLREQQRVVIGIHEIYGQIYKQLELDLVLPARRYRASNNALFHCVMARIANPDSKRGTVRLLEQDFGVCLPLEKIYRMMDQLDDGRIELVQRLVCASSRDLLGGALDVLFFDCTSLYFESFREDELKQNGYSKDNKFNQPQVLLALMVTKEGLPVGYEVFPGATFEGHSLIPSIERLQRRYNLDRVICVADRGMLNKANLAAVSAAGAYYIVADKLKKRKEELQEQILDSSAYRPLGQDGVLVQEIELDGQERLIVSWCPKRAKKDRHDRLRAVERLQRKLAKSRNPANLLNNRGYKQFLKIKGQSTVAVDRAKIEAAEKWDGLHGVVTNVPDIGAQEALDRYRGLWQIEESFRITKHDLKVRPIFHWTPRRIRAHIAIAFMAFSCVRHLMYRVKLQYRAMSAEVIRNALVHVQHSLLTHEIRPDLYVIPAKASPEARKIYQVMGVKWSEVPYRLN
jgi:transposase